MPRHESRAARIETPSPAPMPTIVPRPRTKRRRNVSAHHGASESGVRPFETSSSRPARTSTTPEAGPDSIAESERLIMARVGARAGSAATRGDYSVRAGGEGKWASEAVERLEKHRGLT